jgi:hypothetical protein
LEIADLMRTEADGRGVVNVLAADGLMAEPALYATVLLHLLGEVFEELPEAGELDKPKLVLLLDEAHLMFDGAPKALVEAVERTARLVRSKGVGLWLVTQSPLDVPESVLGQLGNRIHHALRAYTPKDKKAVDSVAETLRPNPKVDAAEVITELGVGEALVSFLDAEGRPTPVERVRVVPPASRIGSLTDAERGGLVAGSPMRTRYTKAIDRESAYEMLKGKMRGGGRADAGMEQPGSAGGAFGAGGGKAASREPTIEEIEAELSGIPISGTYGSAPQYPGYTSEPPVRSAAVAAPRSASRATTSRSAATTRSRSAATVTGGGIAAELARAALSAAGREMGRQVVRSLLGTRSRRR